MWKWILAVYAFTVGIGLETPVLPIVFWICVLISVTGFLIYFLIDPLDSLKVSLTKIWQNFLGRIPFVSSPNYTPDVTAIIIEKYKMGESLEDIADLTGKTVTSIRGKLVSEKVYSQFKMQRMNAIQRRTFDDGTVLSHLELKAGQEYRFDDLLTYLNKAGYLRVNRSCEMGYYSVHGGVVTIHPFGCSNSISIDYFGDTVEAITDDLEKTVLPTVVIEPFSPSEYDAGEAFNSD